MRSRDFMQVDACQFNPPADVTRSLRLCQCRNQDRQRSPQPRPHGPEHHHQLCWWCRQVDAFQQAPAEHCVDQDACGLYTTGRRSHQLPQSPLQVGSAYVTSASVVRDFGIYIDSDVSMKSHVTKTVSACFAVLYQLRSVRQSIPRFVLPRGRTTEMQPLPAFSRTCWSGFSRWWTLLLGWCFSR